MPDTYAAAPKLEELFRDLHKKFGDNITKLGSPLPNSVAGIEVRARATYQIGQALANRAGIEEFRKLLANVLGEIFADTIVSVYLAGCALDNPARILGRRVLELGISVVYLWDQPSAFYGWHSHDADLSFQGMLEYIDGPAFRTFLEREVGTSPNYDVRVAAKLYRSLSNIVHGKMRTFESSLPDRFCHSAADWEAYIQLIASVQDFLLKLWEARFQCEFAQTKRLIPALGGVK